MKKIIMIFTFLVVVIIPSGVKANNDIFDNYVVMDMESKRIFYEKAKDVKKLPASTTNIMTT